MRNEEKGADTGVYIYICIYFSFCVHIDWHPKDDDAILRPAASGERPWWSCDIDVQIVRFFIGFGAKDKLNHLTADSLISFSG